MRNQFIGGYTGCHTGLPKGHLSITPAKNRLVDTFKIDPNKVGGYSKTHKEIPSVNSISGTTYTLAAVLTEFIKKYKNDPDLEKDVNNITQGFLAFTCKSGFHSYGEMLDVLKDKSVKNFFADNNLTLHAFPESILKNSFEAATAYSTQTNLQHTLNQEIIGKFKNATSSLRSDAEQEMDIKLKK